MKDFTVDLTTIEVPETAAMTGRVRKFLNNPTTGIMPASCTVYVFDNDKTLKPGMSFGEFRIAYIKALGDMLEFCAKSLKGGSGVKVQLGNWRELKNTYTAEEWHFYLAFEHPDFNKITNYHTEYLAPEHIYSKNFQLIDVADTLAEKAPDKMVSLVGSWRSFMSTLEEGKIPYVNLTSLRPYGSINEKGLFSSGALGSGDPNFPDNGSFYSVYKYLFQHLRKGDLFSVLQLLGQLNETMLRGGFTKSSITCTAMDWRSPHFNEYLNLNLADLNGSQKQSARITKDIMLPEHDATRAKIAEKMTRESMFLETVRMEDHYSNVCVEIIQKHRSTCLLVHIQGGAIKDLSDISKAIVDVTEFTCKLWANWRRYVGEAADIYLDASEDKQIGIGWIGFANMLAHFGVKYESFINTLDAYLNGDLPPAQPIDPEAATIVEELIIGYMAAAKVADKYGIDRAFTLAPTQRCYQDYKDQQGRMTCRAINPPYQRRVRRSSESEAQAWGFHGNVELMSDVGAENIEKLWDLWQQLINLTGKAHTLSYDAHYPITLDKLNWIIKDSHLETVYYNMSRDLDQSYLNKGVVVKVSDEVEPQPFCAVCAE